MNLRSKTRIATLLLCYLCAASAMSAASAAATMTITGTVHNLTKSRPSVSDDVILLRLANGMEEEARTKTDAQGGFTLTASVAGAQYVVRVMHQGVNYDYPVNSAATLEIRVFDAVRKIEGLSGSIGMVQLESEGKTLKVTEMYGITNASNPPVTQSGPRNFEVSLPAGATLDSIEAKRAEGVWTNTLPKAIPGQARGYAINFPIRARRYVIQGHLSPAISRAHSFSAAPSLSHPEVCRNTSAIDVLPAVAARSFHESGPGQRLANRKSCS